MSLKIIVTLLVAILALSELVHGKKAAGVSAIKAYAMCACKCHPADGKARTYARKDCRFSSGNCAITRCLTKSGYPGWWCCNGPTVTASPIPVAKPLCNRKVCCLSQCKKCGGRGCSKRPGGGKNCCINPIVESGRSCEYYPPPCVLPYH